MQDLPNSKFEKHSIFFLLQALPDGPVCVQEFSLPLALSHFTKRLSMTLNLIFEF